LSRLCLHFLFFSVSFYEEIPPTYGDERCREFMVFDKSSEKPLLCRYWEIDSTLGELGPTGKPYRLFGTRARQANNNASNKEPIFWCFGVKR
jgi:hypothetical protein